MAQSKIGEDRITQVKDRLTLDNPDFLQKMESLGFELDFPLGGDPWVGFVKYADGYLFAIYSVDPMQKFSSEAVDFDFTGIYSINAHDYDDGITEADAICIEIEGWRPLETLVVVAEAMINHLA